jgi:alpha-tubulin suppressor-like RCC1 family protein
MSLRWPNGFISANYDPLKTPGAPTIGTATATGPTSASVTFTAPSNVGGGAITSYIATAKKTSDGTTISGTGSSSPITISGLTTNEAYTVTVAAVNAFGSGPSSAASNSVTPLEQQLWIWGSNDVGQLGLSDLINRSSPVQIGALTNWSQTTENSDEVMHAIKTDGTLWGWGQGSGYIGDNTLVSKSSPVQVGALTNWASISDGNKFSVAIKTNGTLWSWGFGANGRLGLNNPTSYSSPKQVGSLTNWSQVSAGREFALAIKTDGTLWAWGYNVYGQLGLGSAYDVYNPPVTPNYSSPKQVGALTTWYQVSAGLQSVLAIKTDGTLWGWGQNNAGQLGTGNIIATSSPVQIGALTNWSKVSLSQSGSGHALAIKTDGTLWAWGDKASGAQGTNNFVDRSSPVQVGALTTWSQVSAGGAVTHAIKTDGTLWGWGEGLQGKLGTGNTTTRSSPVQIGALNTWIRLPSNRWKHCPTIKG